MGRKLSNQEMPKQRREEILNEPIKKMNTSKFITGCLQDKQVPSA